jgi:adenylosuccinate synthase
MVDVLIGLQWGDEGKGKIVDLLAPRYDIIARFQGGPNAGHTLIVNGKKYVLHTIPSGAIHPNTLNIVGTGTVIDPMTLCAEMDMLMADGIDVSQRLELSDKAMLILPTHKMLDKYFEESKGHLKIGSTLRGIGPAYQDKYARIGIPLGHIHHKDFDAQVKELSLFHLSLLKIYGLRPEDFDLLDHAKTTWLDAIERIRSLSITAIEDTINQAIKDGAKVLAEGAQGSLLDITFGSYPFVTSSNTISANACIGLGIAPQKIRQVIGVFKAYMTRVGSGPFPTELSNETGELLRTHGHEFGATTGRRRRCGWLDTALLHKAIILNGVTDLMMTKSDVLNCLPAFTAHDKNGSAHEFASWPDDIAEITQIDHLPKNLLKYLDFIDHQTGIQVNGVSTGPQRHQMAYR